MDDLAATLRDLEGVRAELAGLVDREAALGWDEFERWHGPEQRRLLTRETKLIERLYGAIEVEVGDERATATCPRCGHPIAVPLRGGGAEIAARRAAAEHLATCAKDT